MTNQNKQPKILGFAGNEEGEHSTALGIVLREEIASIRESLQHGLMTISGATTSLDLLFLKTCVELRIPTIVVLPFERDRLSEVFGNTDEYQMVMNLLSVALAVYVSPKSEHSRGHQQVVPRHLLEWSDILLIMPKKESINEAQTTTLMINDARALGVPARVLDEKSYIGRWEIEADSKQGARHGFADRKEFLDFLDTRFITQ